MNWRPKEGWDAIEIARPLKEAEPSGGWVSQLDVNLVEAGADAMLEALKSQPRTRIQWELMDTGTAEGLNLLNLYNQVHKIDGEVVFIPEESK